MQAERSIKFQTPTSQDLVCLVTLCNKDGR